MAGSAVRHSLMAAEMCPLVRSTVIRTCVLSVAALTCTSAAFAQTENVRGDVDTPGLTIKATAGWDGTVDRSTPIPVSFLIRNDNERNIEGSLTLSDPSSGHEVQLGEIFVSPGAARSFSSIQALPVWFECFAEFRDGDQILWRRELGLNTGNEFVPGVNFVLFIDDGGRRLSLPGEVTDTNAIAATEVEVAGIEGRPVKSLTVKSWQVPKHPGPLVVARAIVFPDGMDDKDLNRAQWPAVAEWMCQGGSVFVHKDSREVVKRLTDTAPLSAAAPVPSGEFTIRRVGLGAIYEYPKPLFSFESVGVRQLIAETVASLPAYDITSLFDTRRRYYRRGDRADINRTLVISFFGFYTLLSGVVVLFLFRLGRRSIGIYTIVIVAGACVVSGLLGGVLRFSRGDLHWTTVTEVSAGGAVQVARIDVQSAGGRNTQVAVKGEQPDLQFIGRQRRRYSRNRYQERYEPFTWQPNLAKGEEDTYQINVPMTPWGRRLLRASAFKRDFPRLSFELDYEPRALPGGRGGGPSGPLEQPSGEFSLKVVNHLPFEITDCRLVIGVTQSSAGQPVVVQDGPPRGFPGRVASVEALRLQMGLQTVAPSNAKGFIDVYQIKSMETLSAGASREEVFVAEFLVQQDQRGLHRLWPHGLLPLPKLSRLGTASAWIVGRVEVSPILTIDEQRGDFVLHDEQHYVIQEILPEDMPAASLFFNEPENSEIESTNAEPESAPDAVR